MKFSDITFRLQGIVLHVKGSELVEHLGNRAAYHKQRMEDFNKQIQSFKELLKAGEEKTQSISKTSSGDPTKDFEERAKDHERKFRFFTFAKSHVLEDAIFECTLGDLVSYELAPSGIRQY